MPLHNLQAHYGVWACSPTMATPKGPRVLPIHQDGPSNVLSYMQWFVAIVTPSNMTLKVQGDIKRDGEWVAHEFYSLVPDDEWKSSSCPRVIQFWSSATILPAAVDSGGLCSRTNKNYC
jgi:hypothetical protein